MKTLKRTTALVAMMAGSGLAQATTLDVCSTCTYQTIADAVAAAAPGDDVHIQAGTYTEHNIVVDIPLTFRGDGVQNTLIDAQQNGRHFAVLESAQSVAFQEMALINGDASGGSSCAQFTSSYEGGSICAGAVAMKLWKMHFEDNTAGRYGGAVVMYGRDASSNTFGRLMVGKSSFQDNEASGQNPWDDAAGGAIACSYCDEIDLFRFGLFMARFLLSIW